jgi:hypothetical protein
MEDVNIHGRSRLIQVASDKYVIQHQCILSPMKTVTLGKDLFIIFSNTNDPVIFPAKVLDLWLKGNVLYLKLWNYQKKKMEMYLQDLSMDESLFLFVFMPFITQLSELMTDKSNPLNNKDISTRIK